MKRFLRNQFQSVAGRSGSSPMKRLRWIGLLGGVVVGVLGLTSVSMWASPVLAIDGLTAQIVGFVDHVLLLKTPHRQAHGIVIDAGLVLALLELDRGAAEAGHGGVETKTGAGRGLEKEKPEDPSGMTPGVRVIHPQFLCAIELTSPCSVR